MTSRDAYLIRKNLVGIKIIVKQNCIMLAKWSKLKQNIHILLYIFKILAAAPLEATIITLG